MATLIEHGMVASGLSLVSTHRGDVPAISSDKSIPSGLSFKINAQFPDAAFNVDIETYLQENGHVHSRHSDGALVQDKNDATKFEEASEQCEPQANLSEGPVLEGDFHHQGNELEDNLLQEHNLESDLCQLPENVQVNQEMASRERTVQMDARFCPEGKKVQWIDKHVMMTLKRRQFHMYVCAASNNDHAGSFVSDLHFNLLSKNCFDTSNWFARTCKAVPTLSIKKIRFQHFEIILISGASTDENISGACLNDFTGAMY